jgi:ATP-dependent exoDNAse (exonuclease V) beta subunit
VNGGISFRGFVDMLTEQAEGGHAAEAPILEEGTDGVRLMTTHKAKGLEFPVVILADITAKLRSDRADRLVDRSARACYLRLGRWTPVELAAAEPVEIARDEAEGVRIAYVAATRARDLLVVPAVGDAEWEGGWISPLNRAVYPALDRRRTPRAAAGCPAFKKDSVWRRPDNDPATHETVCPGAFSFAGDAGAPGEPYELVWWDPHALDLNVAPPPGIRRDALIAKDVPPAIVDEGLQAYTKWSATRDAERTRGAAPSLSVRTATEWAADETMDPHIVGAALSAADARASAPPEQPGLPGLLDERDADVGRVLWTRQSAPVEIVDSVRDGRPGGARFGELVHAVLAAVPLDADLPGIRAVAAVQGRIFSAPAEEVEAAADVVARVLSHELLARARAAAVRGRCRREAPVTLSLADGTLLEGVIDLAFEEQGSWTVIDYKTDRELAASGEARYQRQVALYVAAVERATGKPARGILIRM